LFAWGWRAFAKVPESIAPAYVSDVGYQAWTCEQLAGEHQRLNAALATASTQQRKARTNDTVSVILLGLPVASLSGDNIAPEIARLKGEQIATAKALSFKNCAYQPPIEQPTKAAESRQPRKGA
jgi:hypothetical protein